MGIDVEEKVWGYSAYEKKTAIKWDILVENISFHVKRLPQLHFISFYFDKNMFLTILLYNGIIFRIRGGVLVV